MDARPLQPVIRALEIEARKTRGELSLTQELSSQAWGCGLWAVGWQDPDIAPQDYTHVCVGAAVFHI